MPDDVESKETEAFTQNGTNSGKQKSKSYMDLSEKNKLMKIGIIVLIILILSLLLIIIVLAIVKIRMGDEDAADDHSNDPDVCHTQKCIETAKYLHDNMDLSVDPCEDFYNYTCRGWGIHNPRPMGQSDWGVNTLVEKNLNKQLTEILEGTDKVPLSMQKARNFYKACINIDFRDEYAREALHKIFRKIGGFPMITEKWSDANFDWQKAYVYINTHINSVKIFFDYKVERQLETEKKQYLQIEPAASLYIGSTLIDDYSTPEQKLTEETSFRETLKEYVNAMGAVDSDLLERDIKAFIEFEKKFAVIVKESQEEDDGESVVLTFTEMEQEYKDIDWLQIFGEIFMTAGINITKEEKVYNAAPTYFKKLGKLLKDTPKRTLANYIGYNIVTDFGTKTIHNFLNEDDKVDMDSLKTSCSEETEKFFRVAMNYWYMKTVLGEDAIHDLTGFIKTIRMALTLTINTNKWMQEKTKQQAQLKLNKMLSYLGSPSEVKTDKELDKYYEKTGFMSDENYVYDFTKMSKWIRHNDLIKLEETSDNEVEVPSVVNSYYTPYDNQIKILIGFLSRPNFYPGAPLAVNVPAIGSTIGHEITHGFDNTGSQFDSKGIKHNWWDRRTQRQYKNKVNCFIKQYDAWTDPVTGKNLNGENTVGENIADNGAIHQSFTAYKIYASLKHPEKDLKLPGEMSKFTKDQLFFIAYANTYCNAHAKSYINMQLGDVHSTDDARVIVPLQNSEEFARAFQCKKGSRMNPAKKCILW